MKVSCDNGSPSAIAATAAHAIPTDAQQIDIATSHVRGPHATDFVLNSTPALDVYEDILPASSLLTQLRRPTLWWESASTVAVLVWDSALGGAIGWLANYVFSYGNFVSGQSVDRQSYATFCAGVMGTTSFLVAATNMATQATSMAKLHFVDHPTRVPTFLGCVRRLLRRTFISYVVSFGVIVSLAYGMASLPASTHAYKLHFYVGGLVVYMYVVNVDLVHRCIFQLESVEGQQRRTTSSSSSSSSLASSSASASYVKRLLRLLLKDLLVLCTIYTGAIYIHVSSLARLETSTALYNFCIGSYALKIATQELTRAVVLYQKKSHVKSIYIAVAVPTVLIDTQIRTMILRQSTLNQSVAGSVALAVVEIIFRFAKVWLVRLEIWVREKRVVRCIVRGAPHRRFQLPRITSDSMRWWSRGSVDVVITRPRVQDEPQYVEFLQWRSRFLRFHAAEIHADMVAEYLAIVCSMSIYYFYHAHPKYAWAANSTSSPDSSNTGSTISGLQEQTTYLAIQIAMEMVVDFVSCLWEIVNGVPMQNAKQVRGLISAIFVSCSLANIILSAAISIQSFQ